MPAKRQPSAPSADEMLRWMEAGKIEPTYDDIHWHVWSGVMDCGFFRKSLRAAIRAAMAAERKERTHGKR